MLIRRRKVTIEIEQQTVRMEISSGAPSIPGLATDNASTPVSMETPLPANLVANVLQPPPDTCPKTSLIPPVSKDLQ
jgi:hypothetical protein